MTPDQQNDSPTSTGISTPPVIPATQPPETPAPETPASDGGTLGAAQDTSTEPGVLSEAAATIPPASIGDGAPTGDDPNGSFALSPDPSDPVAPIDLPPAGMTVEEPPKTDAERIAALEDDIAFLRRQFQWPTNKAG